MLHIAWLRFKPGVAPDRVEDHLAACRTLPARVPAVLDLQCGRDPGDLAPGFTHGIVVTLADREAIKSYLEHPAHVPVADALEGDVAELRVIDLDAGGGEA